MQKRILFINNSSALGIGTSTSLLSLIKYLRDEFECSVASDKHSHQLPEELALIGIRHYGLPDRFVLYLPALINLILRGRFDLVYANGSNERSRGAFWATKITKRPLIWHIHESLRSHRYMQTIRYAQCVIANSKNTAMRLMKYAKVPNPIVIPNGVDVDKITNAKKESRINLSSRFGLYDDWMRIINIGRICPDKNQIALIYLAREIVFHCPNTCFIIIGRPESEYLKHLKQLVAQFYLEEHVLFVDYLSDVKTVLQGCDIMVHVSKKESQGIVLLEAMAAQLPIVAYDVGGVGESIIDGKTGYLLPLDDLNGVIQAVRKLIGDQTLRLQMGNLGYERVKEHFSSARIAQKIQEVIYQVLEKETIQG